MLSTSLARLAPKRHVLSFPVVLALALLAACGSNDSSGDEVSWDVGATADAAADGSGAASDGGDPDADASDDDAASDAPPINPGDEPNIVRLLDFEAVTITDGVSQDIFFSVPVGAVSLVVVVEGDPAPSYTIHRWRDRTGEELVYEDWWGSGREPQAPSICVNCLNRPSASVNTFATIVPNNQNSTLRSGPHDLRLLAYTISGGFQPEIQFPSGEARVTIFAKVLDAPPETGVLDINFYFTGARDWSAETAPTDPEFLELIDGVQELYDVVGIELGSFTYTDIDESYRIIEGFEGPDSDLGRLFAESRVARSNALNLFFVGELLQGGPFGEFGLVLGIAGGIPGPALLQGTSRSGVAVALDSHDLGQVPASVVTTMAHEMGHFLGLFHTSEIDLGFGQQLHDPLDDTPQNDSSYLMFNTGEGSRLSPWQGIVMRSNPWVRHP